MKVVVLCGGIGKRMAPTTRDKTLLNFVGKPLIVHQIDTAREAGLNQFIIIANPDNITDIRSASSILNDVKIDFILQKTPSGMADALLAASSLLVGKPFIMVNSNDIFDTSAYAELLSEYNRNNDYAAYLVARRVQNYFPGGYLVINENNEINHIVEKPARGEEPSNLINIVIHLHTRPELLFDYLANTTSSADDIYEKALDRMINENHKLKAVIHSGDWQAIKYPWHILDTMDYFAKQMSRQISPLAHISDKATIDGNVMIEDNVRVFEGAVIRGPSYIGHNSVIGNSALVRDSFIGDNCVIGYSTEIKHSYIGNKCWFHSNYIGDSVVEDDCSFGAGTVTANLRLDEGNIIVKNGNEKVDTGRDKLGAIIGQGCRFGINASLMPGVRIGANSSIGAQVCLATDIKAGKKVLSKSRYIVLPNETEAMEDKRQNLLSKLTY